MLLTTKDDKCEAFNKTASLDGETNLKLKLALKLVNDSIYSEGSESRKFKIECAAPIADLYSFNASVSYSDQHMEIDLK